MPETTLPPDHLEQNDAEGLLPMQWFDRALILSREQRFMLSHILLAVQDWNHLQRRGRVGKVGINSDWSAVNVDALVLFLFDDDYARGNVDGMLTLPACCNALGLSIEDVRARCVQPTFKMLIRAARERLTANATKPLTDKFLTELHAQLRGDEE